MSGIEIQQDYECDDGEVGGPMHVYWSRGHGLDSQQFIEAVIALCLENGEVPRFDSLHDEPVEMWQQNVAIGDGVEYRRTKNAPTTRHSPLFPITLLDLDNPTRGGHRCGVNGCSEPWARTTPVAIAIEVDGEYMAVDIKTCRVHSERLPGPSYRLRVIPVGATIELPAPDAEATPS